MRLHRRVAEALHRDEAVGLASILEVEGSAPAAAGARLARFADGSRLGTIGGGAPELAVLAGLGRGEEGTREFHLESAEQEPGLLCGGRIRVLLETLGKDEAAVFAAIAAALERGEAAVSAVWLVEGRARGRKARAGGLEVPAGTGPLDAALDGAAAGGRSGQIPGAAGGEAWVEVIEPTPRLVVVGAGHVGGAAAAIAVAAGLRLAVLDDRSEYAEAARFPAAERCLAHRPGSGLEMLRPGPADAVLIATRSAELDLEAVLAAAPSPAFYVGLLASRRKWQSLRPVVLERVGAAAADRVRVPVGLAIGARGPGEIALAAVAEVVGAWRSRRAPATG